METRISGLETPPGYRTYDVNSLAAFLGQTEVVHKVLGGTYADWTVEEVGDGNLNLVFIVRGPTGAVAVKQALPYVRLVGESWPLPLSRAHYEHMALRQQALLAPGLVPTIHHYDEINALIVMELLEPHTIMRRGMIAGAEYPRFADDISTFMANTLFFTSSLALTADKYKDLIAAFAANSGLCKITEDLIFTEPYMVADNNRWTTPYLDGFATGFRKDCDLKLAISRLKLAFMGLPQALIHGDLHTGSVMVTVDDTRVIDPEFAYMGPMGFDVGAVIANLLLNYFSQIGHEQERGGRDAYRDWILDTVNAVWTEFRSKFIRHWETRATGDAYPAALFQDDTGRNALGREMAAFMDRLFQDSLGFCGAKMIRRILGLAHNIDLEWIEEEEIRATAEARALTLARDLLVNTASYRSIDVVTAAARRCNSMQPALAAKSGAGVHA